MRPQDEHNLEFLNYAGLQNPDNLVSFIGSNTALQNGVYETVWPQGGDYVYPAGLTTMTISSGDVNDAAGDTGLRTALVQGLDLNFNPIEEIVSLNGQNGVTLANQYYRVNRIVGLTAGATGSNEGIIYVGEGAVTVGVPATVYECVEIGINISHSGLYTVPFGMSAYLVNGIFTAEANKTTEFQVFVRPNKFIFIAVGQFFVTDAPLVMSRIIPLRKILAGTDIQIRAQGIGAVSIGEVMITLALIPDP